MRACTEVWAISKDLGRITGDVWSFGAEALVDALTSPFQDPRVVSLVGAATALDQQFGRFRAGWPGAADDWGSIEDPLATGWDDVVSRPILPLSDTLFTPHHDAAGRRRATTA